MAPIQIAPFSLCPFRCPVEVPKESVIKLADGAPRETAPRQALGQCLGLGCGMWIVTAVEGGQPSAGLCSIRLVAGALNEIATKIQVGGALIATAPTPPVPPSSPEPPKV